MPTAIGAAVIIMSGVYILIRESRNGRRSNTPVLRTRTRETGTYLRASGFLPPTQDRDEIGDDADAKESAPL